MNVNEAVDYSVLADSYAQHRRVHPKVLDLLAGSMDSSSRVLEVGCGTGNYVCELESLLGSSCFAMDPAPAMLEKLRTRGSRVEACLGRAEDLPFLAHTFDRVFSVDVIHHVGDLGQAYREAYRVLRPEGLICTVTDSEWTIRNRDPMAEYFPEAVPIELSRYPTVESIRSCMLAAGFELLREDLAESAYLLEEASSYREKVFSSLLFLGHAEFDRGLERLESALAAGPLRCVLRYVMMWGRKAGHERFE